MNNDWNEENDRLRERIRKADYLALSTEKLIEDNDRRGIPSAAKSAAKLRLKEYRNE